MRRILGGLILLTVPVAAVFFTIRRAPSALAFVHVAVVDVRLGKLVPDQTVLVQGSRIRAVGRTGKVPLLPTARVIDATGLYMIPGLWDMHVHTVGRGAPDAYLPLLIANGITGIRDMGDDLGALRKLRAAASRGRVLSPRLVYGGRIDGPGPRPPFALLAETPAQAKAAVDSLHALGVDFIKIPASLSRETYRAIAEAAKARNLPFAGHVPYSLSAREASHAGQASIEHEDDLMVACTSRETELKSHLVDAVRREDRQAIAPAMHRLAASIRETHSEAVCSQLFGLLARNRTWVTPTLVVYQPYSRGFDSAITRSRRLKFMPPSVRAAWRRRASEWSPEDSVAVRSFFSLPRTREMHRAGVGLLTGTDTPLPYVIPGHSVHEEMLLLVRAGLTPAEALRTATLNPAAFLAATDSLGAVSPGMLADLVLLEADPLRDIRATERIRSVVLSGRYLDHEAIGRLLARAEKTAGQAR